MVKVTLPGRPEREVSVSDGATLGEAAATWFPSAEALVALANDTIDAGEPAGLVGLLARVGAPVLDMVATPFAARAALLGVATGRAFYHHELRQRLAMPDGLGPEVAVWGAGTVPEWRAGVLEEPKYFSFFQDAPLPAFNPNHRGKWRSHELLHGANGFFWNPRMTRFQMYLGARVNELLPVVHWYGHDEILRPRGPATLGRRPTARPDPASERLIRPYWRLAPDARQDLDHAAIRAAERAVAEFCREWDVIRHELETGERLASPHHGLDGSSDAVGYLKGHWNRTTAWSFGAWVESFLVDGVDYHGTLPAYLHHCAGVAASLGGAALAVEPQRFDRLRARRVLQDVGYRTFLALEHLAEGSREAERAERALVPMLESAGRLAGELLDGATQLEQVPRHIDEILEQLTIHERLFPRDTVSHLRALGYRWPDVSAPTGRPRPFWTMAGRKLVADGVQSACPETWTGLEADAVEAAMEFVDDEHFDARGTLASRFAAFLEGQAERFGPLVEQARFEAWASAPPQRDDDAELFATLPDVPRELRSRSGRLRIRDTIRRAHFSEAFIADLLGEASDAELAGVVVDGELRLTLLDDAIDGALNAIEAHGAEPDWAPDDEQLPIVMQLLELGFVVWLPAPA